MKTFVTSARITGTNDAVLQTALMVLTGQGFAIKDRSALSADLTGPGLNSTRQNPLLGASKIHLEIADQELRLAAELGGVETMHRFLKYFPILLGLGLGVVFAVGGGFLFGQQFGVGFGVPWVQGWRWLVMAFAGALLPVSPWLFLSPMMSRMILHRTQNALTTLVNNSEQLSKRS